MEKSIFRYVWRYSRADQIWLFIVVIASMPIYFIALELPRLIVNDPINGAAFPEGAVKTLYFSLTVSVPSWFPLASGEVLYHFPGFEFDRTLLLFTLIGVLMALVCSNGLMKFYINNYKGRLGERMLRRLRYQLFDRMLRFPYIQFKRAKNSEIATIIKDEVEPLGGFIGDAFVQPFFLAGQALTALLFIMLQSFWLGLLALIIVAVQAIIIPQLRRQLIILGKQRQLAARRFAGHVGEVFDAIGEIRSHGTSNYERAQTSSQLGRIFFIRYALFRRKFFVKFLNNFISQLTPMVFYGVGGYLVIRGRFDIGQLLAVIAAYKDLPSPIKEIIDWDQRRLDIQVKYETIVDQFNIDDLIPPERQQIVETDSQFAGPIEASALTLVDESGVVQAENINFCLEVGRHYVFFGDPGSGASACAEALGRLRVPFRGRIMVGGVNIDEISEVFYGRDILYVGAEAALMSGSLFENMLHGLRSRPVRAYTPSTPSQKERGQLALEIAETHASGNSSLSIHDDWIDYQAAGADSMSNIIERFITALEIVELDEAVYHFGLLQRFDLKVEPDLPQRFLEARYELQRRLALGAFDQLVSAFDPESYNNQATLAENLLFGVVIGNETASEWLAGDPELRRILDSLDLTVVLQELGQSFAMMIVELSADLADDHPFFDMLGFITPDEIRELKPLLAASDQSTLREDERCMMLRLAFHYVEPRHRMGFLDDDLKERIVAARRRFADQMPPEAAGNIEFYDLKTYISNASIQDNVLFGRIEYGVAGAAERIQSLMRQVFDDLSLSRDVFRLGLSHDTGTAGKRLTAMQRQQVVVARALVRNPRLLIIDRTLSSLGQAMEERIIQHILESLGRHDPPGGLIVTTEQQNIAQHFQTILVFDSGRLVETGAPSQLMESGRVYQQRAMAPGQEKNVSA